MAIVANSVKANVQYQQHVHIKEQRIAAPALSNNQTQTSSEIPLSKDDIGGSLMSSLPSENISPATPEEQISSPVDEESALIKRLLAKLIEFLNPDDKNNATVKMLKEEIETLSSSQLTDLSTSNIPVEVENPDENVMHIMEFKTFSQALTFSLEGELKHGDKQISLSFQYQAESAFTYVSYQQVDLSQLKDPLVVQYGNTPLGQVKGTTPFDVNSDNNLEKLPIFNGDVGYLVYDKNRNGAADNGSELFGPQTGNGFNELAALDEDNNGFIDSNDSAYHDLYLWQPTTDRSSGRYVSLSNVGITAINTQAYETPFTFLDRQGNIKAQMRYSSFAIDDTNQARGVHQVDVAI